MAYQIAFDLYENATQQFLTSVIDKLRIAIPLITDAKEDNETKNTVSLYLFFTLGVRTPLKFSSPPPRRRIRKLRAYCMLMLL